MRPKILVVDDESGLQQLYGNILLMEGYNVKTVDDGISAFDIYECYQPDLIFVDIVMPGMNGVELVKKIRSMTPNVKAVFMSGFLEYQYLQGGIDAMIKKYGYRILSKPFKVSQMLTCINTYIVDATQDSTVLTPDRFVQGV